MNDLPMKSRHRRRGNVRRNSHSAAMTLVFTALSLMALGLFYMLGLRGKFPEVPPSVLHDVIVTYIKEQRSVRHSKSGVLTSPAEPNKDFHLRYAGVADENPLPPIFDPLASDPTMNVEIGSTFVIGKTAVVEVLFFDRYGGTWPRIFLLNSEFQETNRFFSPKTGCKWTITGIGKRLGWRDGTGIRGTRI